MSLTYEPLQEGDKEQFAAILQSSFNPPDGGSLSWIERQGVDVCRVLKRGSTMVAGLMILDMGQYFGGRSLANGGISAVGVAPEARGAGVARVLMEEAMRELHQRQIPLSALYAATQTLYRKSGFEQAGTSAEFTMDLRIEPMREREPALRRLPLDVEAVRSCYEAWARPQNGALDRGRCNWNRVLRPRGQETELYGVGDPLEGYVAIQRLLSGRPGHQNLHLTDLVALTPRAIRRLFAFLADHRSLAGQATFAGPPHHPMLTALPEQHLEVRLAHYWMLRLVDVPRALAQRGYSPNLTCEVKLNVEDDLLPANQRSWWLRLSQGKASVEPARGGGIKLPVRALACLYGGHLTPWQARLAGLLEATDAELAQLEGLFGAPSAMSDMF